MRHFVDANRVIAGPFFEVQAVAERERSFMESGSDGHKSSGEKTIRQSQGKQQSNSGIIVSFCASGQGNRCGGHFQKLTGVLVKEWRDQYDVVFLEEIHLVFLRVES